MPEALIVAKIEAMTKILMSPELLEEMAAIEHSRWAGWETYREGVLAKGDRRKPEDTETHLERWKRQRETPYGNAEAEHLNKLVTTLRETRQSDAAKIARLLLALEAGPARLREMAADYDRVGLSALQIASQRSPAAVIRSADLINAALHVEAAQQKVLEKA